MIYMYTYTHQHGRTAACIQRALLLNPRDATARRLAGEVMQRMAQGRTYPLLPSYVDTGAARGREEDGGGASSWQPQAQEQEEGVAASAWGHEEEEEEEHDQAEEERYLTW